MHIRPVPYLALFAAATTVIAAPVPAEGGSDVTTTVVTVTSEEPPPIFDPPSPRPHPLFGMDDDAKDSQHALGIADDALHSAPIPLVRTEILPEHTGAQVHPASTPYPPSAEDADRDAGHGSLRRSHCYGRRIIRGMLSVLLLVGVASALVWTAECFYRLTFTRSRRRSMSLTARRALEEVKRAAVVVSELGSAEEKASLVIVESLSPPLMDVEKTRRFYLENYDSSDMA